MWSGSIALRPIYTLCRRWSARKILDMAGAKKALDLAKEAVVVRRPQWAAEMVGHMLALDPESEAAKAIKALALIERGDRQINATAPNSAQYLSKNDEY
nr:alkyl sulfatase dimerization domain-containing protein [Neorhizobium galegae]